MGKCKASQAAAEYAVIEQNFRTDIRRGMNDDCAGLGIAIARVETGQAQGTAVGPLVDIVGSVGSSRGGMRSRLIGKPLQPSRMRGIGTPSMRHQVRAYAAAGNVQQMKSRRR